MRQLTIDWRVACLLPLVAALAACGQSGGNNAPPTTVFVKTIKLQPRTLTEQLTVYGQVEPDPGALRGVSVAHGGEVTRLWVGAGARVTAGEPLLALATEPQARLAYEQAQADVRYATSELAREQKLYDQQLATNAQLAQAKKALVTAQATLAAQKRQGSGAKTAVIHSPYDGIVSAINVSPGDRVAANAVLLKLVDQHRLWVHLGVQPEQQGRLQLGMPVALTPVFEPAVHLQASILQVHAAINPATGLLDAIVALTGDQATHLLPGMWMRGVITVRQAQLLAVPNSAVLSDAAGTYVFVVRDGKAHRIDVQTTFADNGWIGIRGALKAGAAVVVLGNYELQDGIAVRETPR
jgi:RND family efflux transporter MFP subunit